jgi:hypothetical protein
MFEERPGACRQLEVAGVGEQLADQVAGVVEVEGVDGGRVALPVPDESRGREREADGVALGSEPVESGSLGCGRVAAPVVAGLGAVFGKTARCGRVTGPSQPIRRSGRLRPGRR